MELKSGFRLRSVCDDSELMVIRAPNQPIDLRCGGHPVVLIGSEAPSGCRVEPGFDQGSNLGKRYVHEETGLELLCTKPGSGSLSISDVLLPVKDAKTLPSSD